jgi:hypothetical protein
MAGNSVPGVVFFCPWSLLLIEIRKSTLTVIRRLDRQVQRIFGRGNRLLGFWNWTTHPSVIIGKLTFEKKLSYKNSFLFSEGVLDKIPAGNKIL